MTGEVLITRAGAVAQITFDNQEKHNAMSLVMWRKLGEAVRSLTFEAGVHAIVLRGAGDDAFVSGADISELGDERSSGGGPREYESATKHALDSIRICTKPTVAMVHGYCFGAGLALALACDLRYARDDTKFSIPAAKLGFGYAVHLTADLVNTVGSARAKEILLTARIYNANEAADIGLVHQVFDTAEFETRVLDILEELGALAPLTIRAAKTTIAALSDHGTSSELQDADRAVLACFASEDATEGRAAFAEKRKPEFKGH